MINQTLPTNMNNYKHAHFGVRLKSAREALGMDRKEVASQLRLHEQVITMLENGEFNTNLPLTFIRGYIRNYSKLMEIPEKELSDALELLKPQPEAAGSEQASVSAIAHVTASGPIASTKRSMPINIGNFFMQLSTYLLGITLIGLVGIWWHTHKFDVSTHNDLSITQKSIAAPSEATAQPAQANRQTQAENTTAPPAADNTNAALPNAENPDSQTPPNAEDNAASTVTTEVTATSAQNHDVKTINNTSSSVELSTTSNPTSTTALSKSIFPFNPGDKTAITNIVTENHTIHWLTYLALFLIILAASMRLYATQPLSYAIASTRINKMQSMTSNNLNFNDILKLASKFKINKTMRLIILLTLAISAITLSTTWWYNHTIHTMAANAKEPAKISPSQEPAAFAPVIVETPSPDFNHILMMKYKSYSLYAIANQLDAYINQAADTKFNLTDKSTPIGQFTYKKKYRKYRHAKKNPVNNNDNADYNTSYGNSTPPYYYQAYGTSGQ